MTVRQASSDASKPLCEGPKSGVTAAMIFAAGLGTRLRPLTEELPKPLVWIGDRPLLAHLADRLLAAGIQRAVINTHHRPQDFSQDVMRLLAIPVTVLYEPEILGTAGGLSNAREALGGGKVVVWNGDILVDLDLRAMIETHENQGLAATLAVSARPKGQGTVGVDARGQIVRLRGECFGQEASGGDFVGVQVVSESLLNALPRHGCLVGDVYLPWLRQGGAIGTFAAPAVWDDVGTLQSYFAATKRWLESTHQRSYVSPTAVVAAGVDVVTSVVGEGAQIEGTGLLERCIVWPRARAKAPLQDVVVTSGGLVVPISGP